MKKLAISFLGIFLFAISCGPSVEGEQKDWEKNKSMVSKLKNDFPAYTQLIDYKFTEAQKVWEASTSISEEEAKADKMNEANNYFDTGSLKVLKNLQSDIDELKRAKEQILKMSIPDVSFNTSINNAVGEANSAIDLAEEALYVSGELSVQEAENKLNRVGTKLNDATKYIDDVMESIESFIKDQEAKNTTTTTTQENTGNNETTQQAADIKCEYCGTVNPAGSTKCKSCGAPITSK